VAVPVQELGNVLNKKPVFHRTPIENCIFGGIERPKSIRRKELRRQLFFYSRFRPRGLPCWHLAPRKPLLLRRATPTETPLPRRAAFPVGALLPASPCAFVRPRQQRCRYPSTRASRLAPCSPQALAPSSGHANRGAVIRARGLPCWRLAPRKPLRLRRATSTETPFPRHAASPVGALLPASPCAFVRPRQQRRRYPSARPFLLAPCSSQALAPSSGHANPGAFFSARGLPCWRLAHRKPLLLRRTTPTLAPFSQRAAFHVGAAFPASPCFFVGPRQHRRCYPSTRPSMLAPCSPQALASSSDHANRGAVFPARGLPCWRLAHRKPLLLRRTTPTEAPLPERAGFPVGALLPASPCAFVRPRQHRCRYPSARPFLLAPCSSQALAPSSGHANIGAVIPVRGLPCWRLASRKPLRIRQATPTEAPLSERAVFPVGALLPASPCAFVRLRQQRRRYPSARPFLLAPCSPQALASSSDHANRGAVTPARGLSCWRLAPRKPFRLRQATPTGAPFPRRAAFSVRACQPAKPINSVFEREPWNGKRRKSSPDSGSVRACQPAKPMNSVPEREPWNGRKRKSSPDSGSVRARRPAKPINSVSEREPWNGRRRKRSPDSGPVRARRPAKPINSVSEREPPARNV